MNIDNGYVGIGTNNPNAKLDIQSENPNVGFIKLGGGGDFHFDGGQDSFFNFINFGGSGGYTSFGTTGGSKLIINNNGLVMIDSTDPNGYSLNVKGKVIIYDLGGAQSNGYVCVNSGGELYRSGSPCV